MCVPSLLVRFVVRSCSFCLFSPSSSRFLPRSRGLFLFTRPRLSLPLSLSLSLSLSLRVRFSPSFILLLSRQRAWRSQLLRLRNTCIANSFLSTCITHENKFPPRVNGQRRVVTWNRSLSTCRRIFLSFFLFFFFFFYCPLVEDFEFLLFFSGMLLIIRVCVAVKKFGAH